MTIPQSTRLFVLITAEGHRPRIAVVVAWRADEDELRPLVVPLNAPARSAQELDPPVKGERRRYFTDAQSMKPAWDAALEAFEKQQALACGTSPSAS